MVPSCVSISIGSTIDLIGDGSVGLAVVMSLLNGLIISSISFLVNNWNEIKRSDRLVEAVSEF